jgi:adhesin transport system outer membrane protein
MASTMVVTWLLATAGAVAPQILGAQTLAQVREQTNAAAASSPAVRAAADKTASAGASPVSALNGTNSTSSASNTGGPILTLAEAVDRARANPAANSAAALARAAAADRDQAQWALYPRATLGYNTTTSRAYYDQRDEQVQATVSYTLFDGGRARGAVREKDAQAQAQAFSALSKSDQTAVSAVQAYLDVLRYTRLAEIAQANIDRHEFVRGLIAEIASIDRGRRSDLSLVESRLAIARKTLASYLQQKGTAITQFEQTVGQPPTGLVQPTLAPERRVDGMSAELESRIEGYSPDLAASRQTADAANARVDASRYWYVPDVVVQATKPLRTAGQYYNPNHDWYAGVQLQWDTTDRFSGASALRAAQERRESAQQDIETTRRAVRQKAQDLLNVLTSVRTRHGAAATQVDSLGQVADAYWDQFQIGRRSLLDALNMQSDLFASRTEDASLGFDELLLQLEVYAMQGLLDDEVRALRYESVLAPVRPAPASTAPLVSPATPPVTQPNVKAVTTSDSQPNVTALTTLGVPPNVKAAAPPDIQPSVRRAAPPAIQPNVNPVTSSALVTARAVAQEGGSHTP